ncbi:MAG TPA: putative Ig domain-containing protein [Jatrophihabitans sp.]|jgi:hypothetical protein
MPRAALSTPVTGRPTPSWRRAVSALAVLAVVGAGLLGTAAPAAAVGSVLNVTTTADIPTTQGACGTTSTVTAPTPLSLREATCLANNIGGTVTINLPAGDYQLQYGELDPGKVPGQNITMVGAGASQTTIDGVRKSRVLAPDVNTKGGVTFAISGITITGGYDTQWGGAGIWDGQGNLGATTIDVLTISNSVITGNVETNAADGIGAGVQMFGGTLNITNSTISSNTATLDGAGVYYTAFGDLPNQSLSISGTRFTANKVTVGGTTNAHGGAALSAGGPAGQSLQVTNSTFTGNTVTSATAAVAAGSAIFATSGALTVTGSTFTGNSVSGSGAYGSVVASGDFVDYNGNRYTGGSVAMHYNRITGNTGGSTIESQHAAGDVAQNWWGCNTGPNTAGCDTTAGTIGSTSPYLKLAASATPSKVTGPNGTATITASMTKDSAGSAVSASNLAGAFDGLPVSFADPPGDATVTSTAGTHSASFSSGQASIDYHSNTTLGPDDDAVTLDNATVTAPIEVDAAPVITSANSAHFSTGGAGTFTVTTTGYPAPALSESGSLPSGLTFVDKGNGTAELSGTPDAGSAGSYPITVTASNSSGPSATQTLTISVGTPPAITSSKAAKFTIGSAGTFTVTTTGEPAPSITESGTLPAGLKFTDAGTGSATISGTPTGSGGTYPVTVTAANKVKPDASQTLTIQVDESPTLTTTPSDQTVTPGNPVTFTAAATGVPTPTVQWQKSTDGGANFSDIAGASSSSYTFTTARSDDGNRYRAVFTNSVGTATSTAATLRVGTAPSFTNADNTTFVVGQAGSFPLSTTGVPSAALSASGTGFAAWLTLHDNGDGTGTLTGTPPAGSGGPYAFALHASNGFGSPADQNFTLFVDQSPAITSDPADTFTVGSANTFAVTTTAGYPSATAITETGTLPAGVTFHDAGDGTATLSGNPAVGSGGDYPITINASATGGLAPATTQSFTLTVHEPPRITSVDHATFAAGAAGTFTVHTAAGTPSTTTITNSGILPSGVHLVDKGDGTATLSGTPDLGSGGVYVVTLTAANGVAPDATQSFTLTVTEPPRITSANHTSFAEGASEAFTVTTSAAEPKAVTITESGSLPAGVSFVDKNDGTAVLSGTATVHGSFPITVTASNGVSPDATQDFTLTVEAPPAITSADHATFTRGVLGSFTVKTAAGTPSGTTLAESGSLPDGVTFVDKNDGTAVLSGTPTVHGSFPITITASNGVSPDATQSFTLTVQAPPAITSADHGTFAVGTLGSFTVKIAPGTPSGTTLAESGDLPGGVTFVDKNDGTAELSGTPAAGSGGTYPITITASNGVSPDATQQFTLTVTDVPVIASADQASFTVGSAGTFTVTSQAGYPTATALTETGSLPSGLSFQDKGDGTATVAGTPDDGTAGTYPLMITATNSAGQATQTFSLSVGLVAQTIEFTSTPPSPATVVGQTYPVSATGGASGNAVTFAADVNSSGVCAVSGTTVQFEHPGDCMIVASQAGNGTYSAATAEQTVAVTKASTTTALRIRSRTVTAAVAPVAPGAGNPSGLVVFAVGGHRIGTATLVSGVATLQRRVQPGAVRTVSATYRGDTDFLASSVSTARHDPRILARVTSSPGRSRYGWYHTPVTVTFSCATSGAALDAACPAPVTLRRNGAGQSVTRTIRAVDGGAATVHVSGINIDRTAPDVSIRGAHDGATYTGHQPAAACVSSDRLSGPASCTLGTRVRGDSVRVAATAVDRAGNRRTVTVSFRVLRVFLAGAGYRDGAFQVHEMHTYALVVLTAARTRPRFYDAAPSGSRPGPAGAYLSRAGQVGGLHRYVLAVHIDRGLGRYRFWSLGVRVGRVVHRVKFHPMG